MRLHLTVRAKPGARVPGIARVGGMVVVAVRERAVDGHANDAIIHAVAAWLGIPPSRVAVEHGATTRIKRLAITNLSTAHLAQAVERLAPSRSAESD